MAARELLDAAASRERKAAAAQARKGGTAGKRKASVASAVPRKGTDHGAATAAAAGHATAAALQGVSGHGFGAGHSPTNFANCSNFLTGAGAFFDSPGHSPLSQAWTLPQSSDPAAWDSDPIPPGGFTNFIQPHLSQNFNFVGGPSHYAPFKPARPMDIPPDEEDAPVQNNQSIHVDSEEEVVRTAKRIIWSQTKDVRLVE
ncbi:hypothetical protein HU200_040036 [Digitaria exilis]|uniref:Uncharacterized protein n=1 Tax=Digitaria exilis TaxID=1010633 RepID=A0A835EJ52_9POAL|nr:hypothetical protein HU200_040036 [Digitaria exilis]